MKTQRNILVAFLLNLAFSIFEMIGGFITGSTAIFSDSIHDLGDAASIGVSYFLERKSKKQPDEIYTYGYGRFSIIGGFITSAILLAGSVLVIIRAFGKIFDPTEINYDGMIIFAVIGVAVNFAAAFFTRSGDSINQKAVNLHMLEDVLGWIVVLIGAVVMRFTDIAIIDPIMSIGVAVFILINAISNLKEICNLFLEKMPRSIAINEIKEHVEKIDGVSEVHHIHIWSIDGFNNYATMHVVIDDKAQNVKNAIKKELSEHGICHATIEIEGPDEICHEKYCQAPDASDSGHHHHHHHHH